MTDGVGGPDAPDAPAQRVDDDSPQPFASGPESPGNLLDVLRMAVVMLDTTGRIVLWSPPAEELLGWAGEHIVGHRVDTFWSYEQPDEDASAERTPSTPGEPAGPPAVGARDAGDRILAHLFRRGRWKGILPLRHRDGHMVQTEVRASVLADGDGRPFILASLVETSRVRTLEQDLAVLDSLFQSSPLGIAVFDHRLRHVRINESLARMNELTVDDFLGRTIAEGLHTDQHPNPDISTLMDLQKQVLETGTPVIDLTLPAPVGHGFHSFSCNQLRDRGGRVLGISCTIMDVTERHLAADRVERAKRRLDLLNDVGRRIGDLLDVKRIAGALARSVVPTFADFAVVMLLPEVAAGDDLPRTPRTRPVRLDGLGAAAGEPTPEVNRMLDLGGQVPLEPGSAYETAFLTGSPQVISSPQELLDAAPPGEEVTTMAYEAGVHSSLLLPLRAHGVVLGLLVVSAAGMREAYDPDDLTLAVEIADRAAGALDNARLYAREREGAVMLQRSLLPQSVPSLPGLQVAHRYVPASVGTEAGGDWFDVIPLPGARVALVIGDVTGHGLGAAATMGRLRTAVRTLSQLDLDPPTLLRHVNDIADDFGRGPEDTLLATCVYAVYDPGRRRLRMATAGHLPPLLVERTGSGGRRRVRRIDLPSGAPLGVAGVTGMTGTVAADLEGVEVEVDDGAVLVLYTDGLVEARDADITTGIDGLSRLLQREYDDLEEACDAILAARKPGPEPDDIALLVAELRPLPTDATASWVFPAEPGSARAARAAVRDVLHAWDAAALEDSAVLLVSELVTNSLRHARGPIGVRLVRGPALLVEVSDPLPDPPRERHVDDTAESGRGLHLVARTARRWGTRHSADGKVVWFELPLPGN